MKIRPGTSPVDALMISALFATPTLPRLAASLSLHAARHTVDATGLFQPGGGNLKILKAQHTEAKRTRKSG
jgi:hypothetical protein